MSQQLTLQGAADTQGHALGNGEDRKNSFICSFLPGSGSVICLCGDWVPSRMEWSRSKNSVKYQTTAGPVAGCTVIWDHLSLVSKVCNLSLEVKCHPLAAPVPNTSPPNWWCCLAFSFIFFLFSFTYSSLFVPLYWSCDLVFLCLFLFSSLYVSPLFATIMSCALHLFKIC